MRNSHKGSSCISILAIFFQMLSYGADLHLNYPLNVKEWKNKWTSGKGVEWRTTGVVKFPGGQALTWKGGRGTSNGQDPLFMPPPPLFRSPVAACFSSLGPHLEQKW